MAKKDRFIHVLFEIIAIPAGILLIYLGTTQNLTSQWFNAFLITMGLGNIIIDGYLLTTWFKKKK